MHGYSRIILLVEGLVVLLSSCLPRPASAHGGRHHLKDNYRPHGCDFETSPAQLATWHVRTQAVEEHRRHLGHDGRQLRPLETCETLNDQRIEIAVNLHLTSFMSGTTEHFAHPTPSFQRYLQGDPTLTDADFSSLEDIKDMFEKNLIVLNQNAFAETPFKFKWVQTTVTSGINIVQAVANYTNGFSQSVGSGDLRVLDVFCGYALGGTDDASDPINALDSATFPAAQRAGQGDGVYLRYDALTDGGNADYDLGYALVHGVGHWLGLFDVFQTWTGQPCDPDDEIRGDFIADTALMSGPSDTYLADRQESCTDYLDSATLPDSCPSFAGVDPLFNYMNSQTDVCAEAKGEFTCQQVEYMYRQWLFFRDGVSSCDDPLNEVEIELVYTIGSDYLDDRHYVVLKDSSGIVLFNTYADHYWQYKEDQASGDVNVTAFQVDICVSRLVSHTVELIDPLGADGFAGNGSLSIYTDGVLEKTLDGNFGQVSVYTIPPSPKTASPTVSPTTAPSTEPVVSTPAALATKSPTNDNSGGVISGIDGTPDNARSGVPPSAVDVLVLVGTIAMAMTLRS